MDEHKLILLLKEGDKDAFSALYHKYWAKVYNFSALYITSEIEREEVVQEVFIKLWDTRVLIKENENFSGFLFIITRNLIFSNSRKHFNEIAYQTSVLNAMENISYNIEDELETEDLKNLIDRLIEGLTDRQREVFLLSREEHLTYKEIAEKLNITPKTVERHINEALKFLKKNIQLFVLFLSM